MYKWCISKGSTTAADGKIYTLGNSLLPRFVSSGAAASLLSIGESLNQIRSQTTKSSRGTTDPVLSLLPASLVHLNKLTYPLSSATFASTINSIRLSISQNALSQLLPLPKVLEILEVIQEFQLLARGEFAIALIDNADARIMKRSQEVAKPVRKAGRLDDLSIKEAETSALLSQSFGKFKLSEYLYWLDHSTISGVLLCSEDMTRVDAFVKELTHDVAPF